MIPFIYKSTDNMMIQMLRQKNAGLFHADAGEVETFQRYDDRTFCLQIADHRQDPVHFQRSRFPAIRRIF